MTRPRKPVRGEWRSVRVTEIVFESELYRIERFVNKWQTLGYAGFDFCRNVAAIHNSDMRAAVKAARKGKAKK